MPVTTCTKTGRSRAKGQEEEESLILLVPNKRA